ncbi:MAG: PP2C family protein-serine/threonine phosphatase [Candidatus Acidiferrales bacterium]
MSKPQPDPGASESSLLRLDQALGTINTDSEPGELARQFVAAVASQPGIVGARLWRALAGVPAVWSETGELPSPDPSAIQKFLTGENLSATIGGSWMWAMGQNSARTAVLEANASGGLDNEAQRLLDLLSRYAEVALLNSERRYAVVELSTIVEATKRLNSTLDLGELINIILQLATRHTGADRGTVFLVDKERDEIWSLVGLGLAQQEIRLPATKGIAGWVAHHAEVVNLLDAYQDPRFERDVDRRLGYRTNTLLCLPIRHKDGEVIGVLQLLNKKDGPFTAADEGFLEALSDHVALAIENAQLHRERLAKQRMERDLALARSIQTGLLPECPPKLAGFDIAVSHRPSLEVGGDYYDFIPMGPETLMTVVADVEGKGIGSAMIMANVQATLHALIAHVHSLEALVASLNDMILSDTRGQKYLTMFLCLLDQRHSVLHYVNAGHVPPAVVRSDGTVEFLCEGGMVVGLFPSVKFERGHIRLRSGDIFVACTDGITEAMDTEDNEYGRERLAETVHREREAPAGRMVEAILRDVDKFSLGGHHEDDRVILILKVL